MFFLVAVVAKLDILFAQFVDLLDKIHVEHYEFTSSIIAMIWSGRQLWT